MLHDESIHPIESVALIDEEADLAVIKIAARELTFLPIAMDAPAPGVPVSVLSHPNGHYYVLTRGVISRVLDESAPPRDRLQITAPFAIGSSGAPVINDFGNIVGMALSTETIYADPQDQKNPQLVIPTCAPAAAIRAALESN
jgi:S1-C subfamily serine protease